MKTLLLTALILLTAVTQAEPPEGYTALFNGKNLEGWKAAPNG